MSLRVKEVIIKKYICTHCNREYNDQDQALLCYYSHHGLATLDKEYALSCIKEREALLKAAEKAIWEVQQTHCQDTLDKEYKAYNDLMEFDQKTGIFPI